MYSNGPLVGSDSECGNNEGDLGVVGGTPPNQHAVGAPSKGFFSTPPTSQPVKVDLSTRVSSLISAPVVDSVFCNTSDMDFKSLDAVSAREDSAGAEQMPLSECKPLLQTKEDTISQSDASVTRLCEIMVDIMHLAPNKNEFEKLTAHLYEKVKELEQNHHMEIKRNTDKISSLRMEMLEDRVRLWAIEKGLHGSYDADVKYKATELLDRRSKEVYDENHKLHREKALLANDVKLARDRERVLDEENIALHRAVNVNASIESDLKAKCIQCKREIGKLKEQIKTAEDSVEKVSKDYEARLAHQNVQHAKQIKVLAKERDDARCDALRLNAELIKLRKASAQVLCQRGELENFFYEALNEVRAQIVYERRRQLLMSPTKSMLGCGTTTSQEVINASRHTHTSVLRIENQRFLRSMGSPATHSSSIPLFQSTNGPGEGFCGSTGGASRTLPSQGKRPLSLPVEGSVGVKALPPIPQGAASGSTQNQPSQLCVYEQRMENAASRGNAEGHEDPSSSSVQGPGALVKGSALRSCPGGVTWKMIQQVNISELSWQEKERVLQLLFERIRAQRQRLARKAILQAETKPGNGVAMPEVLDPPVGPDEETSKSTLFITQR